MPHRSVDRAAVGQIQPSNRQASGRSQVTSGVWLAAVGALRNFALLKSARLQMLKEGWLNQCSTLLASINTAEREKEQPSTEALAEFLANFTFAADGQVSVPRLSPGRRVLTSSL